MIRYTKGDEDLSHEKAIWDQYRAWKLHVGDLYNHLQVLPLEWPTLTLDWLPENVYDDFQDHTTSFLLMGTQAYTPKTSEEVADADIQANTGWEEKRPGMARQVQRPQNNFIYNMRCSLPNTTFYGNHEASSITVVPQQKLVHEGEVNTVRHMPQNPHLVASKGPAKWSTSSRTMAPVYVYYLDAAPDLTDPASPTQNACEDALMLLLVGHTKEGMALSWNKQHKGRIASGGDDHMIYIWDIDSHVDDAALSRWESQHGRAIGESIGKLYELSGHDAEVQGVDFHPQHQHLLYSVSDDRSLRIWDTRAPDRGPMKTVNNAHSSVINCVQAHPSADHVVATGGKDVIKVWDIRFMRRHDATMYLRGHSQEITCLEWAPHSETVLASGSADRTVIVWDIERHNQNDYSSGKLECCPQWRHAWQGPPAPEMSREDMNIPTDILFVHFGHTAPVTDISWNPHVDWFMASASQDNFLHLWQMSNKVRTWDVDDFSLEDSAYQHEEDEQMAAFGAVAAEVAREDHEIEMVEAALGGSPSPNHAASSNTTDPHPPSSGPSVKVPGPAGGDFTVFPAGNSHPIPNTHGGLNDGSNNVPKRSAEAGDVLGSD